MNKTFCCVLALLALIAGPAASQDQAADLAYYKERVKTLASDEFGGRKPLSPYEEKTIHYIADEFKKVGLRPANGDSYFQPVLEVATFTRPKGDKICVRGKKESFDLRFSDDVVVWTNRRAERVQIPTTPYVFCGFGINAPEYDWNDYEGVDVRGKIVLVLVNDPGFYDDQLFRGKNMTYYGRWTYKFEEALRQGAAGCLVIHETAAASYGWDVCQSSYTQTNIALCSENKNADDLAMKGWIANDAFRRLMAASGRDADQAIAAAKRSGFQAFEMDARSQVTLNVRAQIGESHNVAGILPGTDLADEYLVCTAHWDHFGIGTPIDGDSIYNGASDNASGVAALMLLARKFQSLPQGPRRSIVFVAVTSEECGLLGSQYYCEHPLYPLSRTAANLNFDGVAPRERTRDVILSGAGKTDTDHLVVALAAAQGRVVKARTQDPGGSYFRSDHFNFVKKGVPAILVSGGNDYVDKARHEAKPKVYRYHQPNDEYDESWWDFDGTMEDLNLLFAIGLSIANEDEMPRWTKESEFQRQPDK